MTHWAILLCNGPRTLALAKSLTTAGIDTWTPRYVPKPKPEEADKPPVKRKLPRELPVFAGIVFCRMDHLLELARIRAQPYSKHPKFRFMPFAGGIARATDAEIQRLRRAHEKAERNIRREKRRQLVLGQRTRFNKGIVAGMTGQVVKIVKKGKAAKVDFGGSFEMEIDACDFPEILVSNDASPLGAAA